MRDALVIGVGGTGKWVIAYLKHAIESAKEQGITMPKTALLAFDLAAAETPEAQVSIMVNGEVSARKLDYTPETSKEFCLFSHSDWKTVAREIADDRTGTNYPEYRAWWHPSDAGLYEKTGGGDDNVNIGAGQARQKSRAVFIESVKDNTIIRKLDDALQSAQSELAAGASLDIHIVWSVAGGTGCGAFIDFAALAQREARSVLKGRALRITGYIVLPEGYANVLEAGNNADQMEANCFAGMRELERFMHFPKTKINYTDNPDARKSEVGGQARIFDVCYIVDGTRPIASGAARILSTDEEKGSGMRNGLLPGIADFVFRQIAYDLPPSHAQVWTDMTTDLNDRDPGTAAPLYGTFGTYSILFDADALVGVFAQRLAGEIVCRFKDQINNVPGPNAITEEEHKFLNEAKCLSRTLLSYHNQKGQINLSSKEGVQGAFRFNDKTDKPFPDIKIDDPIDGVKASTYFAKRTAGEVKADVADRMNAIGTPGDQIFKDRMPTFHALFGWYKTEHHKLFAEAIRSKIKDNILPLNLGWGSLAHSKLFLESLVGPDGKEGFFASVKAMLEQDFKNRHLDPHDRIEAANTAKTAAEEEMNGSPKDGNRQKRYVTASQTVANYTVIRLGYEYLLDFIDDCTDTCWGLLKDVNSWLGTFEVAEKAHNDAYAAWAQVRKDWRDIKLHSYVTDHDDDLETKLYDMSTGKIEPVNLNQLETSALGHLTPVSIDTVMQQFTWRYEDVGNVSSLVCCLPAEYVPPADLNSDAKRWNLNFVDNLLQKGYFVSVKSLTVGDMILLRDGSTLADVNGIALNTAQELKRESSFLASPTGNGNNASNVVYIPVAVIDATFAATVSANIGATSQPSISDHAITMQQCNHRLPFLGFGGMTDTETTYRRLAFNKTIISTEYPPLHNFMGERLASIIEAHLDLIGEDVRCLDLEVVNELENSRAALTLARAIVANKLTRKGDAKAGGYQYLWNDHPLGNGLFAVLRTLSAVDNAQLLSDMEASLDQIDQQMLEGECNDDFLVLAEKVQQQVLENTELATNESDKAAEADLKRALKVLMLLRVDDLKNPERKAKYRNVI